MQREQWFHRAVIYQVDSSLFYDANGDGYGDLAGIRQKLHYIRSLGATVLWLTPFYLTLCRMMAMISATICSPIRALAPSPT